MASQKPVSAMIMLGCEVLCECVLVVLRQFGIGLTAADKAGLSQQSTRFGLAFVQLAVIHPDGGLDDFGSARMGGALEPVQFEGLCGFEACIDSHGAFLLLSYNGMTAGVVLQSGDRASCFRVSSDGFEGSL